ncbi:SGNH/GDSL hydrolase family protein [Streptomyces sp. NPDC000410]|uniref:SGNH/GDSL hydrolase family protein n=1 Tax=Streptomyces sp. NPDC000410 TaxID=3154254 RepID=UPI003323B4B6
MNLVTLPVVAAQALWVRARTESPPPPAGAVTGCAGAGTRRPLRVAVIGESTAAGYGVETHDDGFPGAFARELAARTDSFVQWEVSGQYGATARRIRHRVVPELGDGLQVVVLLAGVNDVLARRSPTDWGDDLTAIVDDLGQRAERVAVTGIPPFTAFPSLPGTLARHLTRRADALDEVSRRICAERPQATWVPSDDIPAGREFFARDGFHPAAPGYRRWAQAVADQLPL